MISQDSTAILWSFRIHLFDFFAAEGFKKELNCRDANLFCISPSLYICVYLSIFIVLAQRNFILRGDTNNAGLCFHEQLKDLQTQPKALHVYKCDSFDSNMLQLSKQFEHSCGSKVEFTLGFAWFCHASYITFLSVNVHEGKQQSTKYKHGSRCTCEQSDACTSAIRACARKEQRI